MTRRSKFWLVLAALFTLVNLAGAPIAAAAGEGLHAAVHIGLMLLGAALVWRLAPRPGRKDAPRLEPTEERLERLQLSMDAVALEVERIGEAQRYNAKLQAERGGPNTASAATPSPSSRRSSLGDET
jgi:hypothetical protein